ncbi:CD99 molecule isoform X3 [Larimichthys crocea]|uniref:CD99 molecule isoform X3 n=1 Tax=Larimichthys crocea TaxID=215358 RepID=UPI000F5ED2F2|nr:CD99 antigen isoform X3 [Larimichthys crocea]
MEFCLRIVLLLFLVSGTLTQDGFDLGDALGPDPTPKPVDKPPKSGGGGGGGGGFELDLGDALGPDPKPKPKPADDLPKSGGGGGGGNFDDSDLFGVSDGDYKPEGGKKRAGGAEDPGYNQGGADQPQEAGGGQIAAIVSAVGVAIMGAASSYFAYQKKKLCFKIQGGQDPESGKGYNDNQSNPQSDPQVFSNLLRTS